MPDHKPWIGENYSDGINGKCIAIIGYSHWGGQDSADETINCVNKVMSGEWKIAFFTQIRGYFGHQDHGAFWPQVMFFNYLPTRVGEADQRYGHGTTQQIEHGKMRFLSLLKEKYPQKVFVLTGRHWAFPNQDGPCIQLGREFPTSFAIRNLQTADHDIQVFFLRHPQGAGGDLMRRAVERGLARP